MNRLRAHRRLTTWVATLAVLLAALAPTVSFALGSRLGARCVEVCTVAGSKWVNAGESEPAAPAASHVFEHCPFCSIHTPAIGMPPAPLAHAHRRRGRCCAAGFPDRPTHAACVGQRAAARTAAAHLIR